MTPEEICTPLLAESYTLREGVPVVLTLTASDPVIEQIQIRKDFKEKLQKGINDLSDLIDHLESWKRTLTLVKQSLNHDLSKLEDYKWDTIRAEREATSVKVQTIHGPLSSSEDV